MTRPSPNRSFTIKHTVSLPLRRHSRTQSQLATSVKRHSVPRTWKSRDSRARAVDARSTFFNYGYNYLNNYIRGISIFFERSRMFYEYIYCKKITETRPKKHLKNEQEIGMLLPKKSYVCMTEVWMTILESGWNLWVWLVGVVSRRWVWLVGGIYGYGYHVQVWLVGVVVWRYIDILTIIINFPYSTCISSFFGSSIPTSCSLKKCFFGL